jgi:D-amino-acid dehydrogenase
VDTDTADVVIVGGGIIGSCSAYYLAKAGRDVIVLDPAPGQGVSRGNAGLLCPSYCLPMANPGSLRASLALLRGGRGPVSFRRPVPVRTLAWLARFAVECRPGRAWKDAAGLYELARQSQDRYGELAADGLDLGIRRDGWTYVCHDPAELRHHVALARRLAGVGVRSAVLGPHELREREPSVAPGVAGAVVYPGDHSLDPARATAAIARAARALGARFLGERVTAVDRRGARVQQVRAGRCTVRGTWYVIAAGARSRDVGRCFGVKLPVEAGHGISLTLPASGQTLVNGPVMCADDHVIVSPADGYVRLTSGMEFGASGAAGPKPAAIARMRAAAERTVPALAGLSVPGEAWRGARPMTPTGMPWIRLVADHVIAATGHNTLGMTLGPVTGHLVSDLVCRGD